MQATFHINGQPFKADLTAPLDVSIPLRFDGQGPNCFYAPLAESAPVVAGDFVGSTEQGGLVNFKNVRINPHGNGTHTECVGHISREQVYLNDCLRAYHYSARLVSLYPRKRADGDRVIERDQLAEVLRPGEVQAVVLRTLPNDDGKLMRNYSGTNPPYLDAAAAQLLVDYGVEHLLLDLPSVDREQDEGALSAHRAFWQYPYATRFAATITELVFVSDEIKDGLYLLQHQVTSMRLDASPSKPVLYAVNQYL